MSHLILRNKYKMMGKRAAKAPTLIELVKRISLKETNLKPEVIEEEIEEGLGGSSKGPMFLWLPKGKRLNYILIIFASAQEIFQGIFSYIRQILEQQIKRTALLYSEV